MELAVQKGWAAKIKQGDGTHALNFFRTKKNGVRSVCIQLDIDDAEIVPVEVREIPREV